MIMKSMVAIISLVEFDICFLVRTHKELDPMNPQSKVKQPWKAKFRFG